MILKELITALESNKMFQEWKKDHDVFLSHFFCSIDANYKATGNWEIGYYNPADDKITIFMLINDNVEMKPEDNVFKNDSAKVENLNLEKVKLSFNESVKIFKEKVQLIFPQQQVSSGFIVLQTLDEQVLWNLTFISKTFKFLNFKISAENGEIISHEEIELVDKRLQ